jgi:hypothetical protein
MEHEEIGWEVVAGFTWLTLGTSDDGLLCEHGNEPSGCIKGRKSLGQMSDYYFLKEDSVPCS